MSLNFLKNSIGAKFSVTVGLIFVLTSSFLLWSTWRHSTSHENQLLEAQTDLAMQFDLAIREYAAEKIRPFAQQYLTRDQFLPEVMSTSYIARNVFDKVRKKFDDSIIKFSSDNPRNPLNQAGPEELEIIEFFNNNPQKNEWTGQIEINNKRYYARFYATRTLDEALFSNTLSKVFETPDDVLPGQRLPNAIAKQKAKILLEQVEDFF